jgi:hypothetical protein
VEQLGFGCNVRASVALPGLVPAAVAPPAATEGCSVIDWIQQTLAVDRL